jgi:hypothetical protein
VLVLPLVLVLVLPLVLVLVLPLVLVLVPGPARSMAPPCRHLPPRPSTCTR